jgi:GAF domain-containing protein
VSSQENYIACDINVKSEIVVPILVNQTNIGQIDIDSNTINAFNQKDVLLLEQVNNLVGNYILSNNISINIT